MVRNCPHRVRRTATWLAAGIAMVSIGSRTAFGAELPSQLPSDSASVELNGGRFTVLAEPGDLRLARSLLAAAVGRDSYPGLPRPRAHVIISVAPDESHFHLWAGPAVPEWGAAVAFPDAQRVIVQGGGATSAAGDPVPTLRHELAHLALHEYLDELPPRWFDEGYAMYAAGEPIHDDIFSTNVAIAMRGVPTLASLDTALVGTEGQAAVSYALAYRAVADLARLDPTHGLSLFFEYWRASGSLDIAVRRAYGEPLDSFEASWRQQIRHRYGVLAALSDLSFLTLVFLALVMPLYILRRRRDKRRLDALRKAEAAAAAQVASAAAASSGVASEVRPDALQQ